VPSVDTNVLVRLLAADDAKQAAQATALMQRAARTGESLFVPLTVVLELEWVLRSRYRYPKDQILSTLSSLLETRELVFQEEAAVEHALHYYRRGRVDFAECLHLGCAASAGQLPMMTFDRSAARIEGARLVSTAS
jgi:predicted nucleic-acid-binding protein